MSDDVRLRSFASVFTTKGRRMVFGLAVSYGIIRRHEGTVEVESETGRGTSFRIALPSAKNAVKPQTNTGQLSPQTTLAGESFRTKFLVVDDEESVRELLRDILEKEGHEVTIAANGREALALFAETHYAAVLMDVGLPGMSGWELARAVRERDERIPLAIITGWGEAVGSSAQRAAGVDWVVAKPFTVEQITRSRGSLTPARSSAQPSPRSPPDTHHTLSCLSASHFVARRESTHAQSSSVFFSRLCRLIMRWSVLRSMPRRRAAACLLPCVCSSTRLI